MQKCEWKDGEFEPCDEFGDYSDFTFNTRHVYLFRNRADYIIYFCPFCGADIRKPEPKPEYHNCRCKITPDADHEKERQLHLDLIKLVEYNKGLEFREAVRGALCFLLEGSEEKE